MPCRSVWDRVQGPGHSQRQDRGHQEGEAGPDRGRRPHVCPEGDLSPQAAGQVQPSQHRQVGRHTDRDMFTEQTAVQFLVLAVFASFYEDPFPLFMLKGPRPVQASHWSNE